MFEVFFLVHLTPIFDIRDNLEPILSALPTETSRHVLRQYFLLLIVVLVQFGCFTELLEELQQPSLKTATYSLTSLPSASLNVIFCVLSLIFGRVIPRTSLFRLPTLWLAFRLLLFRWWISLTMIDWLIELIDCFRSTCSIEIRSVIAGNATASKSNGLIVESLFL